MARRLGGWWRLRIVASVCYALVVAMFTATKLWPDMSALSDQQVLRGVPGDLFTDALPNAQPGSHDPTSPMALPNGNHLDVRVGLGEAKRRVLERDIDIAAHRSLAEWRRSIAFVAALAWALPCAALLLLGFVVGWVRLGFKRA